MKDNRTGLHRQTRTTTTTTKEGKKGEARTRTLTLTLTLTLNLTRTTLYPNQPRDPKTQGQIRMNRAIIGPHLPYIMGPRDRLISTGCEHNLRYKHVVKGTITGI